MQMHAFCTSMFATWCRLMQQLGGVAVGAAVVDTTVVAAKGAEAVASQSADKGKHEQITVAVGNSSATIIKKDNRTFEEAPACTGDLTDDVSLDAQGNKVRQDCCSDSFMLKTFGLI